MFSFPGLFLFPFLQNIQPRDSAIPGPFNPNRNFGISPGSNFLQNSLFHPAISGISHNNWKMRRDDDSIFFPTWNFPNQRQQNHIDHGKLCFMPDGLTGTCVKIDECLNVQWTGLHFSQSLTQCGFANSIQEICCPVSEATASPAPQNTKKINALNAGKVNIPITTTKIANNGNTAKTVNHGSTSKIVNHGNTAKTVNHGSTAKIVNHVNTAKTVNNGNTVKTLNNGNTAKTVNNGNTVKPLNNGNIVKPLNNGNTAKTVNNGNTVKPLNNGNTVKTLNNGNTAKITNNGNIAKIVNNGDAVKTVNHGNKLSFPIQAVNLPVTEIRGKDSEDKGEVKEKIVKLVPSNAEGFDFNSPEAEQVCGLYNSNQKIWPWLVSIGRRDRVNNVIEWICLGSLISKEYILTTANCLHKSPNVVSIGKLNTGIQRLINDGTVGPIIMVSDIMLHPKYDNSSFFNNIGMIRLPNPVKVNEKTIPVCFPFVAGVLEIIPFIGRFAKSAGYFTTIPEGTYGDENKFGYEEYKILNNSICGTLFSKQSGKSKQFPNGIQSDVMCGLTKNKNTPCTVSGAPLVLYDDPSNSFVIIGMATGDPTCAEFRRQIVTFTRINSFSSWVREQAGVLPNPALCYF